MKHSIQSIFTLLLIFLLAGCAIPVQPAAPAAVTENATSNATHTISHAMGESEVPVNPQRVVVLDTGELDNALALGATLIGAPVNDALQYQEYLNGQLDGLTDIGAIGEPNLETIVTLKPDLILGSKQRYEAIYAQLAAIAPTVLTASLRVPWQDNFKLHAEALGKSAEAEELLAAYSARTAAIKAALGDNPPTLSIIRFRPGQVRLYLKSSYIGYILQDVGLPRPPAQDQDVFSAEISLEQIADVDADYIFITGYAQDDSDQDAFLKSELWTTLGGVQSGKALDVNDDTWIAGLGVQSANHVLDDLINLFGLSIDEAAPPAPAAPAIAAFPITIEHKMGSTTLTAKPERVVSLGFTDQDYLLALGVLPVGIRDWFGDQPNAVWPWARPLLGDAEPEVLSREFNFEQIARLQPDLIVAIYTSLTQEEYDLLRQIAPVVTAPPGLDDYAITWQEQTRYTGQIVGQTARAEELVTRLEAKMAQARADHPEFEGADYAFTSVYGGEYYLYGEQSTASRFLTSLGFVVPAEILELTANDNGYFVFSAERMDLVDRSLTLWSEGLTDEGVIALLADPLYANLAVHSEGRDLFLGLDLYGGAFSFSSILSLDLLVNDLVPAMALAIDGDPATDPVLGESE